MARGSGRRPAGAAGRYTAPAWSAAYARPTAGTRSGKNRATDYYSLAPHWRWSSSVTPSAGKFEFGRIGGDVLLAFQRIGTALTILLHRSEATNGSAVGHADGELLQVAAGGLRRQLEIIALCFTLYCFQSLALLRVISINGVLPVAFFSRSPSPARRTGYRTTGSGHRRPARSHRARSCAS